MNQLHFSGKGWKFFKLLILDIPLGVISLFLLLPWASVREYRYLASEIRLGGIPFRYEGKVVPYFKRYLKSYFTFLLSIIVLFFLVWYASKTSGATSGWIVLVVDFLFVLFMLTLSPFIIHGSMDFHLPLFCWDKFAFSWKGKLSTLLPLYVQGSLLSILTLGFYTPWQEVRLLQYFTRNIAFGSLQFDYSGDPKTLFKLYLKSIVFGILTLGIYNIWTYKKWYNYTVDNLVVRKGAYTFHLHSQANTLEVFEMLVGNFVLVVCTLGLGTAFAYIRYLRFIINHCIIPETFNLQLIEENENTESEAIVTTSHWLDRWNPGLAI
jgi:uncharacterized membrane protein YjgN (DUF898 family)